MSDEKKESPLNSLNQATGSTGTNVASSTLGKSQPTPEVKPADVSFYLIKNNKWRIVVMLKGQRAEISGENSIVTARVGDPLYAEKLDYLRKHKGNRSNGGTLFVELTADDERPGGSCLLDTLLDLSKESLLGVLIDSDPKNRALSRGAIMTLIMKEKGSL